MNGQYMYYNMYATKFTANRILLYVCICCNISVNGANEKQGKVGNGFHCIAQKLDSGNFDEVSPTYET